MNKNIKKLIDSGRNLIKEIRKEQTDKRIKEGKKLTVKHL